jgi:hypothetical protein
MIERMRGLVRNRHVLPKKQQYAQRQPENRAFRTAHRPII